MRLDFVTIFPEYFAPLELSLLGKARERGDLQTAVHDLRAWTTDVHRTVDDSPYGGGPGMIMKPEPWGRALEDITGERAARHRAARSPARIVMMQVEDAIGETLPVNVPGTAEQYPNWRRKLSLDIEAIGRDPRFGALCGVLRNERPRARAGKKPRKSGASRRARRSG